MNPLMQMLMSKLQTQNLKGYQKINQLMQAKANPEPYAKQVFSGLKNEEKQNILNNLKQMGCPNEILSQFQNLK